jgi:hypothetical protein
MGNLDRIVRSAVGLAIIFLYANGFVSGTTGNILLVIAAVMIVTSLFAFCPFYSLFGFNTVSKKGKLGSKTN